jgi:hypothetical protein
VTFPELLTELCTSVGGTCWPQVEDARWVTRSAAELANAAPVATVQVLDELDDLPWSTDLSEVFDGVRVKYRTVDYQKPNTWQNRIDWTSDRTLPVPTLDDVVTLDHPVHAVYTAGDANTTRYGTGTDNGGIPQSYANAVHLASNRWRASWRDDDEDSAWMVSADGTPSAEIRAVFRGRWIDAVVELGNTSTGRVFEYDAGQGCQDVNVALVLATRLYGIVRQRRWRCARMRILPEIGLCKNGDMIRLQHPDGLDVRAVVVGEEWSHEPGEFAHWIDVAVCPATVADFNAAADAALGSSATVADFNAATDARLGTDATVRLLDAAPLT